MTPVTEDTDGAPKVSYRALARDVKLALLSEIGARAVFDHIGRRARDPQLAAMATSFNKEGIDLVANVQDLLRSMGVKPKRTSLRRRALARALVHSAPILGSRRVLRIIRDAERTVARWYAEYALFLVRAGDAERARAFEEMREQKERRANALSAWVDNLVRAGARVL